MNEKIFFDDVESELLVKMNGAILRKAEMGNNFEEVYTRVFENLTEMQILGFIDVVEVLGECGG